MCILVAIRKFSLTAACAPYQFDLLTEHLHGHDFRISGYKTANPELFTERHCPQIFPRLGLIYIHMCVCVCM